jgi:hypothetical protein
MRKSQFFGILSANVLSGNLLLAVILLSANLLLAGLVFTACSDSSGGGSNELRTSTYYGESSEGIIEITFSNKSLAVIAPASTPRDGDYYMIKLNGELISSGQVTVPSSGGGLVFVPSASGSSQFSGTLGSNGALSVPAIPLTGGRTISLPSTNPSVVAITTVQGAAIQAFNPDYEGIKSSGFKIVSSTAAVVSASPDTGQSAEYAVSENNTAPVTGWQRGLEFAGLDANTVYYVWARSGARVTATKNYSPGTAVKGERTVTTAADSSGLLETLNGLTAGAAALGDGNTVKLTGKVTLTEALEIEYGVGLIIDHADAELDAKGFAISGAGRLEVSKGTLKVEFGKIGVDTIFMPDAKYIRTSSVPQVSETIIGSGGIIEIVKNPSSDNAINFRKSGIGCEYSITGNAVIKTGKSFILESQDLLYVEEDSSLTVIGTLYVKSGGKVDIDGTIDIGAGTWTGSYESVTLTDSGTFIVPSGTDEAALNETIADIKEIDRGEGADYPGNVVIKLTQAFYNTAVTNFIAVDPGADGNAIPYTIRGLGRDITANMNNSAIPKLGVGMWLANNNVTLEDVSFKIVAAAEGLVPARPWTIDTRGDVVDSYGVAVLLARTETGDFLGGCKNVTVQNCAITLTGDPAGETLMGGIWVYGSPTDISILGNIVNVTGREGNAVQALAFDEWGDNIKVKNNKLTAKYATQPNLQVLGEGDFYARPAGAFYIGRFFEKPVVGTFRYTAGDISGNTLSYDPQNASVFSFFVCVYPRPLPASDNSSRKGVAAMGNMNFGDPLTTWALESAVAGDCHRLVVGDLIEDCRLTGDGGAVKNGFGAVLMYVSYKEPDNINDKNIETYKIAGGKLSNIGICAWPLSNGDYAKGQSVIEGNVTVNANGTTAYTAGSHLRYWK